MVAGKQPLHVLWRYQTLRDNCPKKSKKAKARAVAIAAESGKMDSTNSGANSKSKKE